MLDNTSTNPPRFALRSRGRAANFLAWSLVAAAVAPMRAQERPNIIFLFTDDHASHAISAYGSNLNETPNIDRLAKEGMLFKNCFCTNSICAPSRAVILTGKHSHINGVPTNAERFDGSQQTFPKLLQKAGYQTAMIGKWHLKTDPTGFDYFDVLRGQGNYYNPKLKRKSGMRTVTGYTTDILTDLALDWLEDGRDGEKPFLLMLQHKAPHRDWQPGPKHLHTYDDVVMPEPATLFDDYEGRATAAKDQEMTLANHFRPLDVHLVPPGNLNKEQLATWNAAYGPKNAAFKKANLTGKELVRWRYQRYIKDYLRCIASVDDNIGRVLEWLSRTGLDQNTIVVYSSDQGFYLGDHGWYDKRWMYEESLRMPLLVRWPGVVKPGSVNHDLVQNLDFAQTLLSAAGVTPPGDMQGLDATPLLRGNLPEEGWRRSIYYHYTEFPGVHAVARHCGVRTQRYKLIHYYQRKEWELYDLQDDPDELRSRHDDPALASVRKQLEAELERLKKLYRDDSFVYELPPRRQRKRRVAPKDVRPRQVLHVRNPTQAEVRLAPDPARTPLAVAARLGAGTDPHGVVFAHGGGAFGYALLLHRGQLCFSLRTDGEHRLFKTTAPIPPRAHVAATLDATGSVTLFVNGQRAGQGNLGKSLIRQTPAEGASVGRDRGSQVFAEFEDEQASVLERPIHDLRVWVGTPAEKQIAKWSSTK